MHAKDLICASATINARGSSSETISVKDSLTATAVGRSTIKYSGNPSNPELSTDESSVIEKILP